jgi:hypothetical protein
LVRGFAAEQDWWLIFTAAGTDCELKSLCSPLNPSRNAAMETSTRTSHPGGHVMLLGAKRVMPGQLRVRSVPRARRCGCSTAQEPIRHSDRPSRSRKTVPMIFLSRDWTVSVRFQGGGGPGQDQDIRRGMRSLSMHDNLMEGRARSPGLSWDRGASRAVGTACRP